MASSNMPQDIYSCQGIFLYRNIQTGLFHRSSKSPWRGDELREFWREVRHHHESRIDLLYEFPIGFGLDADALPLWIVAEGLLVGSSSFTAGMRQDISQRLALKGFVGRRPVRHVFDSVLLEKLYSVFAEAAKQVVELAFESVVDAEFVDGRAGWRGDRLFLSRGKPVCGREKCRYRKRLEQGASFHGRRF